MPIVYVVTDQVVPDYADRLRAAFPEQVGPGPGPVSAGSYGPGSVLVGLVEDVAEESAEMAAELARHGAAPDVVAAVRAGTARYELDWDLTRDPDLVPETAGHLLAWARALAAWSGGVALVDARPLTSPDQLL